MAGPEWAKPRDAENLDTAAALAEVARRAQSVGITDADMAAMVSRPGRVLSVWTVRAWRERHRANVISLPDAVRLVAVLDEWVARPLIDLLVRAAGMEAVDLPELHATAGSLERAALTLGAECGQLQAAVVAAGLDGVVTAEERAVVASEAADVVREACHLELCAGGGK